MRMAVWRNGVPRECASSHFINTNPIELELKHRTFVSGEILLLSRIRGCGQTLICGRQHAIQSKRTNNESVLASK